MKRRLFMAYASICTVMILGPSVSNAQIRSKAATAVILDTDMWGDIDDVLALAELHALQDRGEAKILAITSSTSDKWCASYIDLIDTFYGHPDIPVGLIRNGVTPPSQWAGDGPAMGAGEPMYTEYVSKLRKADGALMFRHALRDGSKAADSIALLRKTLAAQPDDSVEMIEIGFGTNFARLLESKPDGISAMDGAQLIRSKVRLLSMMVGRFADARWQGEQVLKNQSEYNVRKDIPSAQKIFWDWPTPIVVSGSEIGFTMRFKGADVESRFKYAEYHPVVVTYRYMDKTYKSTSSLDGVLHDHKTFDPTAVLYAIRPDDGYFGLSPVGKISISATGVSTFEAEAGGSERYLTVNDEQRARALEAMTSLISEPPLRTSR